MSRPHFAHWPPGLARSLPVPATSVSYNLEVSARRFPERCALDFYGRPIRYAELEQQVDALAGALQAHFGIAMGDRVVLYCQNGPHFVIGYYGILRADAVVVPVNPMCRAAELRRIIEDTEATTLVSTQELWSEIAPLLGTTRLDHALLGAHAEYLGAPNDLPLPDFVRAPARVPAHPGVTAWREALDARAAPAAPRAGPDDLAVLPYTSGTTGAPLGCMHTHRSVLATASAYCHWRGLTSGTVALAALPMFHVTGMQSGMNAPIQAGATAVVLARWDRDCAARQIERARVTSFTAITTMMVDLLSHPELEKFDLSSLVTLGGGGAAMPEAVAEKLAHRLGLEFIEGYGLTETMAPTHINPPLRPKRQCAGIPIFDVDARVIEPLAEEASGAAAVRELGPNEAGEIVVAGPQLFQGYWRRPEDTARAFVEIEGRRYFRTGDLGYFDDEGYFFVTDRLKRMINASGYKVWPAEVEAALYAHPDIREACVIGARDARRGETVKALVVLRPEARGRADAEALVAWARERMAAYKVPRVIEFVDALPRSATGKIAWRALQEAERARE